MDPKIIKAAKEVPAQLKSIVDSMFEESKPALRTGVSGLRGALSKIETYLQEVEQEHLGTAVATRPTRAKATKRSATKKRTAKRKARKTGKQFAISAFVLKTLGASKKPMKAAAVTVKLAEAAPGKHADASGAVHHTLQRLKTQGKVKRMKAGWKVA